MYIYIHIPMHIYTAYAHYLPIICDIWFVCRAKCILYFVPCHELHFHLNVYVAYEYFYIGFSKKAESEHTYTLMLRHILYTSHSHTQKSARECFMRMRHAYCAGLSGVSVAFASSDLLEPSALWCGTALCERKKELHRYLCLCATVSSKLRHHDAQCIYCRRLR